MAAPADSAEQAFRLRRFSGVNTLTDPVFLGPQFLASSQNWIPAQSYRLAKRPGSRLYCHTGSGVTYITAISRYYKQGLRYLYWYAQRPSGSGSDALFRTIEDTSQALVTTFTEDEALGRLIRYGDYLYVGNGIEDLKQVKLDGVIGDPGTVVTLTPIGDLTLPALADPNPEVILIDPTTDTSTPRLQDGSYSYCWAVYNTVTKLYTKRSDPFILIVPVNAYWKPKSPSTSVYTLGTNEVFRLFVAPQGWPIEYATAQGKPDWTNAEERTLSAFDVTDDRVPLTNNVRRTGNMFVTYLGRVVFSGHRDDPNAVYATGVILPGLEQDVFNQGAFFPASARIPLPDRVTGLGVSGSTGPQDPRSPLVAFTATKTFLYMGDPFDPESDSAQIQLSDRIGCPAHDTIVPTPVGLVFMGIDSVYLLGSEGGPPQDIGWPISDQIRDIPVGGREACCAIYHKFFYKLAIPIPGGGSNMIQWWLDLRQGVGQTPSWWGPHIGLGVSAFATALQDPDEQDKGFAALDGTDTIFIHHQMNLYYDLGYPVKSVLRSGVFDAEQPFNPKVFTRLRAIARAATHTTIGVTLITDGGTTWNVDAIDVDGPAGSYWAGTTVPGHQGAYWAGTNVPDHPPAHWLHLGPLEIQTITPVERPRGLSVEIILSHGGQPVDATDIQLRDFEILFLPSGRKVRYLGEKVPM